MDLSKNMNNLVQPKLSTENDRVCVIASNDINLEMLSLRMLSALKNSGAKIDYISQNPWLTLHANNFETIERIIALPDPAQNYTSTFSSAEIVSSLNKQIGLDLSKIKLEADEERAKNFQHQWLDQLPKPYVGITWSTHIGNGESVGISVEELMTAFSDFSGTLLIFQENPSSQDIEYISNNIQASLLDCSDIYHDPQETLAVLSLIDSFVGVANLSCNLLAALNNTVDFHLLWPKDLELDIHYTDNSEHHSKWFPSAHLHRENSGGWKDSIVLLQSKFSSEKLADPVLNTHTENIPIKSLENIDNLIQYASTKTTDLLNQDTEESILEMVDLFNLLDNSKSTALNIFVYHTDMKGASKLQYKDVALDLGSYDYTLVLRYFINAVNRWQPNAKIFLVTDANSDLFGQFKDEVFTIGLNVSIEQPMYERTRAMCAYVYSNAFNANTLFLDSDAFLNSTLDEVLESEFDIAITTRDTPGLMPVNEGVIVANANNKDRVRNFFRRYVATYDKLADDSSIANYYENIKKWRGGQLTLNAISYGAFPYSPYRIIDTDGSSIKVLPCDPYNYSWEYSEKIDAQEISRKKVIHVKGGRKSSLNQINTVLETCSPNISENGSANNYITPHFAIFNKMFNEPPFTGQESIKQFANNLLSSANTVNANTLDSGALIADDMFVWFRNLGFLSDTEFTQAFAPYQEDALLRARIWRVYMLCWAVKSCLKVEGDFADFGCYDGRTVHIMTRFIDFNKIDKDYYLYDLFENPTPESRKAKHGPNLHQEVCNLFSEYPRMNVIKGPVPDSFEQGLPDKIAFAQIDLNEATPELETLKIIYDRVTPGGMIIFDDFGFKRYSESHHQEMDFFRTHNDIVFESPTGQGLFIKRG